VRASPCPDDLERALAAYRDDHAVPPAFTAVAQAALRAYLAERGYLPPARPLRIRPAERGSGQRDTSIAHDRVLADDPPA
jgi:hypothetical protein